MSSQEASSETTLYDWKLIESKASEDNLSYVSEQYKEENKTKDPFINGYYTTRHRQISEIQCNWKACADITDGEGYTGLENWAINRIYSELDYIGAKDHGISVFYLLGFPSLADINESKDAAFQWQLAFKIIERCENISLNYKGKFTPQIYYDPALLAPGEFYGGQDPTYDYLRQEVINKRYKGRYGLRKATVGTLAQRLSEKPEGIYKEQAEKDKEADRMSTCFITFKSYSPIRQLLAGLHERSEADMPCSIICAAPEIDHDKMPEKLRGFYAGDRTSNKVKDWLSESNYKITEFIDDERYGGKINLYTSHKIYQ
ncbi:hypothetical protein BS50DRAFT_630976 [Corynespora cassiicola Philippines]|uniref:Uncharacterized protein n=1 Tax=Corynespora cassiicola Philippines TaxID=1448308 RepID=A0A2T2NZT7_CORCC|nr:hypothetical protein BS50DRAFT_630976 [Corynespora cassiicola Philippines]